MDSERFDRTARILLSSVSRRTTFGLFTGTLAVLLDGSRDAEAGPHSRRERHRRGRGRKQSIVAPPVVIACDPAAPSGIAGLVLIGPMCPVMQVDVPCPDQPFVTTLVARDSAGVEVCTTQSGEDGRFRIGLPPGEYELGPPESEFGRLPYTSSQPVTVLPGQYTEVLVSYDSGIR